MSSWRVILTEFAELQLKKLVSKGALNGQDIKVLRRWLVEMEDYGPAYIASSKEWHDHELQGSWQGYRSSAFSSRGRIIYRIKEQKILIEVCRVAPDHDYKR